MVAHARRPIRLAFGAAYPASSLSLVTIVARSEKGGLMIRVAVDPHGQLGAGLASER